MKLSLWPFIFAILSALDNSGYISGEDRSRTDFDKS